MISNRITALSSRDQVDELRATDQEPLIAFIRSDVDVHPPATKVFRIPKSLFTLGVIGNMLGFILLCTLVGIVGVTLLLTTVIPAGEVATIALLTAAQFAFMGAAAYYYVDKRDLHHIIHRRPFTKKLFGATLLTVGALMLVNVLTNAVTTVIGVEPEGNELITILEMYPELVIPLIAIMIFLVGPVEEYIFRGVLQGILREAYSMHTAVLVAGTYFGLAHIVAVGVISLAALPYILVTALLGFVFGYIYEYTESLTVVALAHGLYNSVLLIIAVLIFL